jgi:hypothetical protein
LALDDGQTRLVGAGEAAVPELGGNPATELWAAVYDIDDNNQIDFGDLSFFAAAFGKDAGPASPQSPFVWWSDFDKGSSGKIDFGDLAFFAPNFNKSRTAVQSDAQTLVLPANFPEAWRPTAGGGEGEGQAVGGAAVREPAADDGEDQAASTVVPITSRGPGRDAPERIAVGFVDILAGTDAAGFDRPDGVRADDHIHAVIDREFARIGAEGTEAWTTPVGGTGNRQPVSLERNQRLARFGDRWDSWEDTLTLLAERTPKLLQDDVPNPYDAPLARAELGSKDARVNSGRGRQ